MLISVNFLLRWNSFPRGTKRETNYNIPGLSWAINGSKHESFITMESSSQRLSLRSKKPSNYNVQACRQLSMPVSMKALSWSVSFPSPVMKMIQSGMIFQLFSSHAFLPGQWASQAERFGDCGGSDILENNYQLFVTILNYYSFPKIIPRSTKL